MMGLFGVTSQSVAPSALSNGETSDDFLAGNAVMEFREMPQKMQVMLAPGDDIVEVVTGRDAGAGHQQQDLPEGIDYAPGLPVVLQLGKVLQKQIQTRTRTLTLEDGVAARVVLICNRHDDAGRGPRASDAGIDPATTTAPLAMDRADYQAPRGHVGTAGADRGPAQGLYRPESAR